MQYAQHVSNNKHEYGPVQTTEQLINMQQRLVYELPREILYSTISISGTLHR
jgi:hypothetical protein